MKPITLFFILLFALSFTNVDAQTSSTTDKKDYKVRLFNDDEFANLHMWFYHEVQKMRLSQRADEDYGAYLSMHVDRMQRLDDKDKGLTKDEIIKGYNEIFNKLNADVKPILNEDQYLQHLEIMSTLTKAIINKLEEKMGEG